MKIALTNKTKFRDADLRKLVLRTLGAVGYNKKSPLPLRVDVRSSRGTHTSGEAALGRREFRHQGLWMKLVLPARATWKDDTWRRIVAVTIHECMHLVGADHKDMTEAQNLCTLPIPAWAEDLQLRDVEVVPKPTREERTAASRANRLAYAQTMLAKAEKRTKLAAAQVKRSHTLETKWRRRVALLNRQAGQ